MIDIFVTNCYVYSKNYLNLFNIVPNRMGGSQCLAIAIINFESIFGKKIKVYSPFSKWISSGLSSPFMWNDHLMLSPFLRLSVFIASLGIIVLNVDAFGFGVSTFVIISITFIHSLFYFLSLLNYCKAFYKYFPIS